MTTAVASGLSRKLVKGLAAVLVVFASGLIPMGVAQAADLVFPVVFIPVYSQDENITGAFTDTRITLFNPSKHCPVAIDPGCVGLLTAAGSGAHLEMIWFDTDEDLVTINSVDLTAWDVEVITGGTGMPNGTGTAIFVNLLQGLAIPVLAFFHPLAAVVEIGAKLAPGPILDPAGNLFAVTASEAQLIPALAGEFARVEISAGPGGAPILFGPGWETVIAETCLISGIVQNYIVDDAEKFLYNITVPCTGLNVDGPDLILFTPDDGGLLGTIATAAPLGKLKDGYNRLAIDVNTTGGPLAGPPFFGATFFYGEAFVLFPNPPPGPAFRQAYAYNMQANYFFPFTALQAPTQAQVVDTLSLTTLVGESISVLIGEFLCPFLAPFLGGDLQVETNAGPLLCCEFFGTCSEK
jgi:hypothetical protein